MNQWMSVAAANDVPDTAESAVTGLFHLGQGAVYLMGTSFILGSLFTILILMLLDFLRRNKTKDN